MVTPAMASRSEVDRLPEELLVYVFSLTSRTDACRAAAVSRAFRAAADSDAVWSRFLPRNFPQFAKGELPRTPMAKKELFRRLSGQPALLPRKMMGMQIDRATGGERLTFSARALQISQFPSPHGRHFRWVRLGAGSVPNYSKRDRSFIFSETALFRYVEKLGIHATVQRKMLSPNTTYAAFMVFKLVFWGQSAIQEAMSSVGVAGANKSTRQVFLQGYVEDGGDPPQKHIILGYAITTPGENAHFPRRKTDDGWMEVELGEFYSGEGDDSEGVVSISFVKTSEGRKNGLFLLGIELTSKQHGPARL